MEQNLTGVKMARGLDEIETRKLRMRRRKATRWIHVLLHCNISRLNWFPGRWFEWLNRRRLP